MQGLLVVEATHARRYRVGGAHEGEALTAKPVRPGHP